MKYIITNINFEINYDVNELYDLKNNFKFVINKNLILNSSRGIIFKNDENIIDLIIGNIT